MIRARLQSRVVAGASNVEHVMRPKGMSKRAYVYEGASERERGEARGEGRQK